MTVVHELSRGDARRLTMLQIAPTASVAPSVDLVVWSRARLAEGRGRLGHGQRRLPARRPGPPGDRGLLTVPELPDSCAVPWRSSGWNDHRNVERLLDLMVQRGEVATAGRRGRPQATHRNTAWLSRLCGAGCPQALQVCDV